MKSLSESDLSYLRRYGFDAELFESWRDRVARGELSLEHNQITAKLCAPASDQILDLPGDETERARLRALGEEEIRAGRFGVVILNGGMATRFGGEVKGVVDVFAHGAGDDEPRRSHSFLELKIRDTARVATAAGGRIPIFLMNSFATDERTKQHLAEHDWFGYGEDHIRCFTQFVSVRMTEDGDIFETDEGGISLHGPGHGDFAPAFRQSGALGAFLADGGETVFVANVDNLGARVDPLLIGFHVDGRSQATVEVAPKWPGDVGGSPYLYEGKLQLVEQIRYPPDFDPGIVDVFNTNTFHFDAASLDRDFDLGYYFVEKKVDGRKAIQIERLIGEMTRFLKARFVRVKRTGVDSRFFPIKTREDLTTGREEIELLYRDLLDGS
ncbi:MAG: UTP--glucose-1-phosphate uridylyltransferase [Planctomycetes bacterium]|nr:UTP--glucose-1-phosphate uridylyltransferase [Planctomycetota bacterium]